MKFAALALILAFSSVICGQTDLQKLVETEHAFARLAAEKGTRTAFLANITDDGLVFNPEKTLGKAFWTARGESKALLSWAPNYADVSSDGSLGYTTGNWEWRAKGKDDVPSAFGEFITIWWRQPDGKYRFAVDIGIGHGKPAKYSTDWTTSKTGSDPNKLKVQIGTSIGRFANIAAKKGAAAAYAAFAANDIRLYREDHEPFLGVAALAQIKLEKGDIRFEDGEIFSSTNIAYFIKGYTRKKADGTFEKGNAVQIWKFHDGKWKIVLDILKPVPVK